MGRHVFLNNQTNKLLVQVDGAVEVSAFDMLEYLLSHGFDPLPASVRGLNVPYGSRTELAGALEAPSVLKGLLAFFKGEANF